MARHRDCHCSCVATVCFSVHFGLFRAGLETVRWANPAKMVISYADVFHLPRTRAPAAISRANASLLCACKAASASLLHRHCRNSLSFPSKLTPSHSLWPPSLVPLFHALAMISLCTIARDRLPLLPEATLPRFLCPSFYGLRHLSSVCRSFSTLVLPHVHMLARLHSAL